MYSILHDTVSVAHELRTKECSSVLLHKVHILCDGAGVLNHRDTVYTAMSDTHTAEEFLAIRKERSKGNCFSFELENLGLDEGQYT